MANQQVKAPIEQKGNRRKHPTKKVIMARLINLKKADSSFDFAFWQKIGPKGRFSAAWEMVKDITLIRGRNVYQPRLRRSIQNIERI